MNGGAGRTVASIPAFEKLYEKFEKDKGVGKEYVQPLE